MNDRTLAPGNAVVIANADRKLISKLKLDWKITPGGTGFYSFPYVQRAEGAKLPKQEDYYYGLVRNPKRSEHNK